MAASRAYHMYIVRCSGGRLYIGSTENLAQRVNTHNSGRGPVFTRIRLPVQLMYSEPFPTMAEARQREIQIKKWSRTKKEALITGDQRELKNLRKRRKKWPASAENMRRRSVIKSL